MNNKLISVIVPIYNVEKYLDECIQSIKQQTYKNIEIILVDDGSTDNCGKLCDLYMADDSRIKVIHKKNGGLSDARNAGIQIAKGEYLTVIDSDDFVYNNFIEHLYQILIDNDADMAVCQRIDVNENSEPIKVKYKFQDCVISGNKNCMRTFFTNSSLDTVAWAKLYKTKMFNKVNYPYGKYHEDVFTTYLIISQCETIAISSKQLYCYRHRDTSISGQAFTKKHLDSVEGTLQRREFIKKEYPEILFYANAGVVYAANQCSIKLAKAKYFDKKIIAYLQKQYRIYELDFLKGNSNFVAKTYSILAWINLNILVHIIGGFKR